MKRFTHTLAAISFATLLVAGCSGGSGIDPQQLAQQRLDHYVAMYQEIGRILENNSGKEAMPKLKQLKEDYIQKFAEIGRQHAKLSRDERREFTRAWKQIRDGNPQYEEVQKLRHRGYRRKEGWTQETAVFVDGFSMLPNYADSVEIKITKPEEAERLGIG